MHLLDVLRFFARKLSWLTKAKIRPLSKIIEKNLKHDKVIISKVNEKKNSNLSMDQKKKMA